MICLVEPKGSAPEDDSDYVCIGDGTETHKHRSGRPCPRCKKKKER